MENTSFFNGESTGTEAIAPVVESKPARNEKGQLLPGNTANPNGRPKKKRVEDYYTEEEMEDLINKLKTSDRPEIWYKMAEMLFGKPRQNIGLDGGEDGKAISVEVSERIAGKRKLYDFDSETK